MGPRPGPLLSPGLPGEPRAIRPAWAWTPAGLVRAPVLAVDGAGRLVDPEGLPVQDVAGIVIPGLINAHTHLELGSVTAPEGLGFIPWLAWMRASTTASAAQAGQGVYAAIRAGTAAVGEISNTGASGPAIAAAKLPARRFHEIFGVDVQLPAELFARPTPHAPHSTNPDVVRASAALPGPWSIHFDEDPEEAAFLRDGGGAWVAVMDRSGRDRSKFPIPGCSPAAYLAGLGVLSSRTLLVHATCTRGTDLDVVAASGARVCLCVRSNLRITGRLPDVDGLLARGVPLAVGTDSLASSPDLDPFAEGAALRRAFPDVDPAVWLRALTEGGADALDLPVGRLAEGLAPGLLLVDVPDEDPISALFDGTPRRKRWLSCPLA